MSEMKERPRVAIVGGGLAGCECAMQLADAEIEVLLLEMKPGKKSEAHTSDMLAELVCSNSLRSTDTNTAIGLLKDEMRSLNSIVMRSADKTAVPAGKALAVDRDLFAAQVTAEIDDNPNITVERREVTSLSDPALAEFDAVVIAAGPLAGEKLSEDLANTVGGKKLFFYDAIAPIVSADSVNMDIAFWASRYKPEEKDYLNCPMNEEQYKRLVQDMLDAEKVVPREFEKEIHFEGCLPVEEMARRGEMTLAFGPLKPVGLEDPRTGEQAFAVVQLRPENKDKTALNLVGFQTKLTYPEQKRVFRTIPGLENVEFLRLGSIHRNTYVDAPDVLTSDLELKSRPGLYLAGQITGVEGYLESAACGLWVGMSLAAKLTGRELQKPPEITAIGALLNHLCTEARNFQPSNVHFGLMPALNVRAPKRKRKELYAKRTSEAFAEWMSVNG